MHFSNSLLADCLVICAKARAFKATNSRPRPNNLKANAKAKKFGFKAKAKAKD